MRPSLSDKARNPPSVICSPAPPKQSKVPSCEEFSQPTAVFSSPSLLGTIKFKVGCGSESELSSKDRTQESGHSRGQEKAFVAVEGKAEREVMIRQLVPIQYKFMRAGTCLIHAVFQKKIQCLVLSRCTVSDTEWIDR